MFCTPDRFDEIPGVIEWSRKFMAEASFNMVWSAQHSTARLVDLAWPSLSRCVVCACACACVAETALCVVGRKTSEACSLRSWLPGLLCVLDDDNNHANSAAPCRHKTAMLAP